MIRIAIRYSYSLPILTVFSRATSHSCLEYSEPSPPLIQYRPNGSFLSRVNLMKMS